MGMLKRLPGLGIIAPTYIFTVDVGIFYTDIGVAATGFFGNVSRTTSNSDLQLDDFDLIGSLSVDCNFQINTPFNLGLKAYAKN